MEKLKTQHLSTAIPRPSPGLGGAWLQMTTGLLAGCPRNVGSYSTAEDCCQILVNECAPTIDLLSSSFLFQVHCCLFPDTEMIVFLIIISGVVGG